MWQRYCIEIPSGTVGWPLLFALAVVGTVKQMEDKAIRDGKYLARHMPVLGNIHPIKIKKLIFFRDVISLLARVDILLIDTATQEVPMKNIQNKLSIQFLRYAIELLHVKRRICHK